MNKAILATVIALGVAASAAAPARAAQILNLSCVEALVSIGRSELAGVFSFIQEKDAPAAFADLVARNKKSYKAYLAKVENDYKTTQSLTSWDHEAVSALVALYGSPLAETLEHKLKPEQVQRLAQLSGAPTIALEQMTARRKK